MDTDAAITTFLGLERLAVAGVSRSGGSPANAIARRLRETGHQVFAINPAGGEVDGHPVFPNLAAVPGGVQGVVVVTSPAHARTLAAEAKAAGAEWIWFHQGFGPVSFDDEALRVAHEAGLKVIDVGCPMMDCCPDVFHRCARAVFRVVGRIPATLPD